MQPSEGYFREEQQFRQHWVWLTVGVSVLALLPLWFGVYQQLVEGIPWGENPTSDEILLLVVGGMSLLILGILYLFWNSRLVVSLNSEGIRYRFTPFHRRVHLIRWTDVDRAFIRTYRPIIEYGGWGVRFGLRGKAYNVSGNQGLQLCLKDGKKILFGTQEPQRLEMVIKHSLEAKVVV